MEKPVGTPQSWLQTHWKLVLVVSLTLSLCAIIAVFAWLRNSDVVRMAITMAESNSSLAERLGRPLVAGLFVTGTLEVTPASGHAELAIPVSGPQGKGTIYVRRTSGPGFGTWKCFSLERKAAARGSTHWRRARRCPLKTDLVRPLENPCAAD